MKKFKVWDSKANDWFKPVYRAWQDELREMLLTPSGELVLRTMKGLEHCDSLFPDRYVVVFFTGKTDNEGTEILDGSIIEFDKKQWGGDGNIHVVSWDEDNAEWSWGGGCTGDMQWRKVIGHYLSTPDLLKP